MKYFLIQIFCICFLNLTTQGQVLDSSSQKLSPDEKLHAYYLHKAKTNRTAGLIFLIGGSGLFVWGVAVASNNLFTEDGYQGMALFLIGGAAVIASIPILVSATNNKKQANFYLRNEKVSHHAIPQLPRHIPAVGISIPINGK